MTAQPPLLDTRRADEVVAEVEKSLRSHLIEWQGVEGGGGHALVRLFGRLSELIIHRLNKMPENHFREFLNTAGIDLLPPRNAKADLSFTPFEDGPDVISVPAGTQVNTQPSVSSPDELIFETERDLNVFSTSLIRCIAFDPNTFADRTKEASGSIDEVFPAFEGRQDKERDRILYLSAKDLFSFPDESTRKASTITLIFDVDQPADLSAAPWTLDWRYWDWDEDAKTGEWKPIPQGVVLDGNKLGKPDNGKFELRFKGIPAIDESTIGGIMFALGNQVLPDLERGILSTDLRQAFRNYGAPLDQNATLATVKEGETWRIRSGALSFTIAKKSALEVNLDAVTAPWIACKLTGDAAGALPVVWSIKARRRIEVTDPQTVDKSTAFSGLQANTAFVPLVDLSDEFYPLGLTPGRLDTFYLSADEAFSKPGAMVTIRMASLQKLPQDIFEGADNAFQVDRRRDIDDLKIIWDYYSTKGWKELGSSTLSACLLGNSAGLANDTTTEPAVDPKENEFIDTTCAFTGYGSPTSLHVQFRVPKDEDGFKKTLVAERDGYWVRARLVSGSYTMRALVDVKSVLGPFVFHEAKTYAPLIKNLTVEFDDYVIEETEPVPIVCRSSVDGIFRDYSAWNAKEPAAVFAAREQGPALYLGFSRAFPVRKWVTLLLDVVERQDSSASPQTVTWEYWNGTNWSALEASDSSQGLTVREYLGFYAPANHQPSVEFGQTAYWLRARPAGAWSAQAGYREEPQLDHYVPKLFLEASGSGSRSPAGRQVQYIWRLIETDKAETLDTDAKPTQKLRTIDLNTVQALNAETIKDEVLGSSDGKEKQVFHLGRTPVLAKDAIIVVREPDRPPQTELDALSEELRAVREDAKPILESPVVPDKTGWVCWHRVPHFYDSGKDSRHYVLDPTSGEVRFGDGVRGKIPPAGRDNIRAVSYRAHNGAAGNVPAGTITVLRNPSDDLANIRSVTNHEAAVGGSIEEVDEATLRGPQTLKHRGRAVTRDGYGWLVQETGSQVALANGLVARGPDGQRKPGWVDVVVVPKEAKESGRPMPSTALLRDVNTYLKERALANLVVGAGQIRVKGPDYVGVKVSARVIPKNPEKSDRVLLDVDRRLREFLHPLYGGPERSGWGFGRDVYLSEIAAVIESVEGVDHASKVHLSASQFQSRLELSQPLDVPYDLPAGSQVSTFDDRTKLVLVESVFKPDRKAAKGQSSAIGPDAEAPTSGRKAQSGQGKMVDARMTGDPPASQGDARSLAIVGFKVGDEVMLVANDGREVQDDLTIAYLVAEKTRVTFDQKYPLPGRWNEKGTLRSTDDRAHGHRLAGNGVHRTDGLLTGVSLTMTDAGRESSEPAAMAHVGFRAGEKVILCDTSDEVIQSNLTIEHVADEMICVGFQQSFHLDEWGDWTHLALHSKNGPPIRLPLCGVVPNDDDQTEVLAIKLQSLVVGDRVSVVVDGRRHPDLELLKIDAIDRRDDRIFVPENYLVYSDKHDIQMALE